MCIRDSNFILAGWRDVPVNEKICGTDALRSLPYIKQAFINPTEKIDIANIESRLLVVRRKIEIIVKKILHNFKGK